MKVVVGQCDSVFNRCYFFWETATNDVLSFNRLLHCKHYFRYAVVTFIIGIILSYFQMPRVLNSKTVANLLSRTENEEVSCWYISFKVALQCVVELSFSLSWTFSKPWPIHSTILKLCTISRSCLWLIERGVPVRNRFRWNFHCWYIWV